MLLPPWLKVEAVEAAVETAVLPAFEAKSKGSQLVVEALCRSPRGARATLTR